MNKFNTILLLTGSLLSAAVAGAAVMPGGSEPVSGPAESSAEKTSEVVEPVLNQCAETEATSAIVVPDSLEFDESEFAELDELVVVRRQNLVQSDGATLTYNVTEDPSSATSNILDILRKVPGVTVDAEDNVKVKGQSSFKILLNGREDPMLKGDIKTVLKSLPASTIKKIEVISEPGAKYEAEGVGGILNIVTDRSRTLAGFMTQVSAWANPFSVGGSVNARTKVNKVMLDASVNYNSGRLLLRRKNSNHIETESLDDSSNHLMVIDQKNKSGWDYTGVNLNMSWEPDTLNLFTISANFGDNGWDSDYKESRAWYGRDMSLMQSLERRGLSDGGYKGFGVQASYQHNFGREDHNIVASYQFDRGWMNDFSKYLLGQTTGGLTDSPYSELKSWTGYGSHIVQIDYADRFSPKHLLEAGAKMNLNDDNNVSRTYSGESAESIQEKEGSAVGIRQLKDIYALYASYSGSFSKWNVKAGVRYEHTRMGARYKIGDYPDFTTHLNDVVPNAAVSYNLASASSLRLAYQMRISRPGINVINPYVNTLTPGVLSYGNPDLKSALGHGVSLNYSNYGGKFGGNVQLSYRYEDNGLTDIMFMKDNVIHMTYANVGKSHMAMLDLSGDWNITQKLRWSLYASGSYSYFKADSEMLRQTNAGWQTNVNTNLNYTLPAEVRLTAYGGFWTPWRDLQSHGDNIGYYYGLGASKSWLKDDALTLQVNLQNLLPTHRTNRYVQEDATMRMTSVYRFQQWSVGMSISYRFGGLKASVKQTSAVVEKESAAAIGGGNK